MRICYLADGRYVHTHKLLRYFSEHGHEMHLLSFAPMDTGHVLAVERTGARYHGELEQFHVKRWWRTLANVSALKKFLRAEQIDILHCHFLGRNAWFGALSGFHPFIVTVMGGDVTGPEWQPGGDIRERYLTPLALRRADLITCWSKNLTAVIKRFARPGVPVEVIHGGVDLERFSPGPKPEYLRAQMKLPANAKVILSPRLMRPLYNLDVLARAAQKVCAKCADAYFVFAVLPEAKDTAYEARVRDIVASDEQTRERVRFIGAIPHNEMADHFRLADVTVSIPSTDGTPMSVLESMACETPVIVGRIPDYDREYIEPDVTALAVATDNADELAAAILRILSDDELFTSLAVEARVRVTTNGSYEAQMSRLERLYAQLT